MGLDIIVYRSKNSMNFDLALIGSKKDPYAGQYDSDSGNTENQIPRDLVVARELRIGNLWDVVELREDLKQAAGSTGLPLLEWCIRNGSHSGDSIRFDLLENLEHEIQYLFKTRKVHFYINLYVFLSKMLEAIQIARQEKNPIIFV
jgi:hypothetical protein